MAESRDITVDGKLVRGARARLWLRKFPWKIFVTVILLMVLPAALVFGNESPLWLRVEAGLAITLYLLWPAISYYFAMKKFGSWAPGMVYTPMRYHFGESHFGLETDFVRIEIVWTKLVDILKYNDVWVLQFGSKSSVFTLAPTVINHPGVKEILNAKLATAKAKSSRFADYAKGRD